MLFRWVNHFEENKWIISPLEVLYKFVEDLLSTPNEWYHKNKEFKDISRFISRSTQRKMIQLGIATCFTDLEVPLNGKLENKIVNIQSYLGLWTIGVRFILCGIPSLEFSDIKKLYDALEMTKNTTSASNFTSKLIDIIKISVSHGYQAEACLFDTVLTIINDPDQLKAQLQLLNDGKSNF